MKKYLITFLCSFVVMTTNAVEDITPGLVVDSIVSSQTLNETKIVVADAYYVNYSSLPIQLSSNESKYVIGDEAYSVGWESVISYFLPPTFDPRRIPNFLIISMFDFDIPAYIDSRDRLCFKAGTLLASKVEAGTNEKEIKRLYAVPEQWLLNLSDTATYIIDGFYNDEEILTFEGGIAFMFEDEIFNVNQQTGQTTLKSSSCTLSPVYRNIRFYNPNGIHQYAQFSGSYPLNSQIEQEMVKYVKAGEGEGHEGHGNGGRVNHPIDPRPIKSRMHSNLEPQNISLSSGGIMNTREVVLHEQDIRTVISSKSVYIAQVNDSTVHVYNLYGAISEVNVFYLHNDSSFTFMAQPIDQSTEHSVYAFSSDPQNFVITGTVDGVNSLLDALSWGETIPVNHEGLLDCYYDINRLYYTDGSTFYVPGSAVRGDVNRDGNISIADVTALISTLLSGESEAPNILGKEAYDCNLDDKITIADVTVLISYLFSGTW